MKLDMRKIYRFEPVARMETGELPTGGDIYYECTQCSDIVSSVSFLKAECGCGNLSGAGGSTTVLKPEIVTPLRGKLR